MKQCSVGDTISKDGQSTMNPIRNIKRILLLLIVGFSIAHAQFEGPLYDVSEFDVYGVKLGMTADEAAVALSKSLGVEPKRIKRMTRGTGENRTVFEVSYYYKEFTVEARLSRVLSENNEYIDIVEKKYMKM